MAGDPIDPPALPSTAAYLTALEQMLNPAPVPASPSGPLRKTAITVSVVDLRAAVNAALLSFGNDYRNSIPQIYTAP